MTSTVFVNQLQDRSSGEITLYREQLSRLQTQSVYISTPSGRQQVSMSGSTMADLFNLSSFTSLSVSSAYMGREWELSYRLGMRPWILCRILCSCGCGDRSISCLPIWSRLVLAMLCLWVFREPSTTCSCSRPSITFSCTRSTCSVLLEFLVGHYSVLCTARLLRPHLFVKLLNRRVSQQLWLQVWTRGRDI